MARGVGEARVVHRVQGDGTIVGDVRRERHPVHQTHPGAIPEPCVHRGIERTSVRRDLRRGPRLGVELGDVGHLVVIGRVAVVADHHRARVCEPRAPRHVRSEPSRAREDAVEIDGHLDVHRGRRDDAHGALGEVRHIEMASRGSDGEARRLAAGGRRNGCEMGRSAQVIEAHHALLAAKHDEGGVAVVAEHHGPRLGIAPGGVGVRRELRPSAGHAPRAERLRVEVEVEHRHGAAPAHGGDGDAIVGADRNGRALRRNEGRSHRQRRARVARRRRRAYGHARTVALAGQRVGAAGVARGAEPVGRVAGARASEEHVRVDDAGCVVLVGAAVREEPARPLECVDLHGDGARRIGVRRRDAEAAGERARARRSVQREAPLAPRNTAGRGAHDHRGELARDAQVGVEGHDDLRRR